MTASHYNKETIQGHSSQRPISHWGEIFFEVTYNFFLFVLEPDFPNYILDTYLDS